MKKRILPMEAALSAMRVNPNNAATTATTKNRSDHESIHSLLSLNSLESILDEGEPQSGGKGF